MSRIRRERQQADEDIGPLQKRIKLRLAVIAVDAVDLPGISAPARYAKAHSSQRIGGAVTIQGANTNLRVPYLYLVGDGVGSDLHGNGYRAGPGRGDGGADERGVVRTR